MRVAVLFCPGSPSDKAVKGAECIQWRDRLSEVSLNVSDRKLANAYHSVTSIAHSYNTF